MSSSVIQLLVLAGIAIFLILRLRNALGTREGFEKPPLSVGGSARKHRDFEVIEGGPDRDITDHVPEGSDAAKALGAMKRVEPDFSVGEFLSGARGAYEMILVAFQKGDIDQIRPFLGNDVLESFSEVVEARQAQGLTIDAHFMGVRETALSEAKFDDKTREGEITVRFEGEQTSVVRDKDGKVVEGNPNEVKRQRDVWTFARPMGADDPNWQLVATGG